MIYLSNEPYPQEISVPRSFGVIVPQRNTYLSTADIAADLTTDSDTKVLAASQGVALKAMVDAKADASDVYTKQEVDADLALKADKSNTYTKAQVDGALAGKADVTDIPTKTSDLTNDSGFVTGQEVSQVYETKSDATAKETALQNAINRKQDILTFDNVPTNGSSNPVKSDGIYDALATKQPNISDLQTIRSGAAAGATAVQPAELSAGLATKQDTLESGVNIKTINNQSLLGSGNIDIQGGGGEPEIFWAEYGVTTLAEIETAYNAGKLVACAYGGTDYILASVVAGSFAYFGSISNQTSRYLLRSTISWTAGIRTLEITSDKVSDIPANRTSTSKYPNTKAVYDALGKYGVISQTQTWTQAADSGYGYTMSNQVWGLIPQANIDLYESAGAVFNETTGYFELNGLTDISYEEMKVIYNLKGAADSGAMLGSSLLRNIAVTPRTLTPIANRNGVSFINGFRINTTGIEVSRIEAIGIGTKTTDVLNATSLEQLIYACQYIKHVGVVGSLAPNANANLNLIASNAFSLETFKLTGLTKNISFKNSSRFSLSSVVYMVDNAANTTAITITLHATAYARCQADTTEYTYQGNTYTGIIAYANARNITIASE